MRRLTKMKANPLRDYEEKMGAVLWWSFPVMEPPYCGSPLDCGHTVEVSVKAFGVDKIVRAYVGGWPGYHTHWTPIEPPDDPRTATDD